ncbi:hypothetical protein V8E55_007172 [Tylopilus felleus]
MSCVSRKGDPVVTYHTIAHIRLIYTDPTNGGHEFQRMSAIWARLRRAWSREGDDDTKTLLNEPAPCDESSGRFSGEPLIANIPTDSARRRNASGFQSFGRGGIGNIRRLSQSLDTRPTTNGQDDFSQTVGRKPIITNHLDRVFSVGRGGAGNIRSFNVLRGTQHVTQDAAEAEYEARLVQAHATTIRSSGRGGAGNIFSSRRS